MPSFPHTSPVLDVDWSNFHATIANRKVAELLRPTPPPGAPSTAYGDALRAILKDSFDRDIPIRTMGARWSLSNVIAPGQRVLEPSDLNRVRLLDDGFARGTFAAHLAATKSKAALVEGGAHLSTINQRLGESGYAIRTSGAADGQRLAGLIATATHGSNLTVGALHETVKALHIVIAPDKAVLVQPARNDPDAPGDDGDAPFTKSLADVLANETGIPTELVTDDEIFSAAVVGIGSFGFVYSIVLDVAPLYVLDGAITGYARSDARVEKAIRSLDAAALDLPADPYHFAMVVLPYAEDGDGVFVTSVKRVAPAQGTKYLAAAPRSSMVASNVGDVLAGIIGVIDGLVGAALEHVINAQSRTNYGPMKIDRFFPGQVFGPTRLPPGNGSSTEVCVDHRDAWHALEVVLQTLRKEAAQGRHLLAALGVRFAPATRATLGMNVQKMNCYIELPTIHASYTDQLFRNVWKALDDAGISYAYHWGQVHHITPARVEQWYGGRAKRWKTARETLLGATARRIFAAPILADAGLG